MTVIICNSLYHLVSAVNIKANILKDVYTILILSDATLILKDYSNNKKLNEIFDEIYFVENKKYFNNKLNLIRRIITCLFPFISVRKWVNIEYRKCTDFYFTDYSKHTRYIFTKLWLKNKNIKSHKYEDGVSTYTNHISKSKVKNVIEIFLHKLFKINFITFSHENILLYDSDLYCFSDNKSLVNLPKINMECLKIKEIYNEIFNIEKTEIFSEKFLFIGESFFVDNLISNEEYLLKVLIDAVGVEEIIIKPHPRDLDLKNRYPYVKLYNGINNIPFEILAINKEIENKVIISISSNSVITPSIMSNVNCTSILLYKLFKGESKLESYNYFNFLEKYKKKYENNKLYIPETVEELLNILKLLKMGSD